jgi:hypothetical protein
MIVQAVDEDGDVASGDVQKGSPVLDTLLSLTLVNRELSVSAAAIVWKVSCGRVLDERKVRGRKLTGLLIRP